MKISVFTPMHKFVPEFFESAFNSLVTQDVHEWVILLNGQAQKGGTKEKLESMAPWIKVYSTKITNNVGALKNEACYLCTGDILVELDYDDYLTPDCIEEIRKGFEENPEAVFAYSNGVSIHEDGTTTKYSEVYGWKNRVHENGHIEMISFPPKPQHWRRIEWSPNHVKAFRKDAYRKIGGHNSQLEVGDDHELMCRILLEYGESKMLHIDKCLYYQRIYAGNTHNPKNRLNDIQKQTDINYINFFSPMMEKWCDENGYMKVDLGGRFGAPEGYTTVDLLDADIIMDLDNPWTKLEDNSVGILRAYHVLEHLEDPIHFFNEAYRVLAPGGLLAIEVPSSNGEGAFADPTHKKFFNTLSFSYYTEDRFARYIRPQYTGKFQATRVVEYWWENPKIPIISAQMLALKGWYDEGFSGYKGIQ